MIVFQDVCKSYGAQVLLDRASFKINAGEHVGIVGPNGAGKSTVFGIITGAVYADKGTINTPKGARVGYLHQHLETEDLEVPLLDYVSDAIPELEVLHQRIVELERRHEDASLQELGRLQTEYEALGGYQLRTDAEIALCGLGFHPEDLLRPLDEFSGGWQMRASLARVIISKADIMLLDEPSNYLDLPAIEWLQRFLQGYKGTLLLISHDRYLLKRLTRVTLEVNGGLVTRYAGNYDFYVRERQARLEQLTAAKKNQDRKREQLERSIERFRAKNTKASQVKSWEKTIDKMDTIDLPDNLHFSGTIVIPDPPHSGNEMIRLEKAGLSYDGETFILRDIDIALERGQKMAIVGYNGTGKTTLLRMLSGHYQLGQGSRVLGHKVVIGYQAQEFGDILPEESTVYDVVKGACPDVDAIQKARGVLGAFGFTGDAVDKPCKVLSGGEKIRLCFARIFVNPPNFLILDEPTTHLDIASREALQEALKKYQGTVCVVSHDIEFVRAVAEEILAMEPPGVKRYFGNYEYYLQKSAELAGESTEDTSQVQETGDERKKRRQERAALRQAMQKDKKAAEKKVAKLEAEIESLEAEQKEIHVKFAENAPDLDFTGLNRRWHDIGQRLEQCTSEWEDAAVTLDEIMEEYNKIHDD